MPAPSSHQRAEQLEILYDLTSAMVEADGPEHIYESALDALFRGTQCARAAILLFDSAGVMRFVARRGLSDAYCRAVEGHTPWTRDTVGPTPIVVQDVEADIALRPFLDTILRERIRALTFIPLVAERQVIGKFMLYYDVPHVVSPDELRLAETIARHVALAIARARANQRVVDAELRFRQLAVGAPVGIFQTDAHGDCLFVNERWCVLAGRSPDQAAGRGWIEAIHPDDRDRVFAEWYGAAERGCEFTSEYRFQAPDGRVSWVAGAAAPVKNAAGAVVQYLGTITDITDRKLSEQALAESERRFRTLADTAPALIWFNDPDGACRFVNRQYLDFFGTCLEDIQGHAWQPLLHPDDRSDYIADWRNAITTRRRFHHRTRIKRHDGQWRWIESHALPLFSTQGEFLGHVGVSPDITETMEAERRKDEFLAVLAHELRNPLAALRSGFHVLSAPNASPADAARVWEVLNRQLFQLMRLVDDLLDVSRITQGKITLQKERVSIGRAVAEAVEGSRSLFDTAGQTLTVELPSDRIDIDADPVRLAQVFGNVLSNASKFTPAGGQIWVIVERDRGDAVVTVRDTGLGMTAAQLPRIFDMFSQAAVPLASRAQGGLGIGLSLARRLIDLHGGRIDAHSDGPDRGSAFALRLPMADAIGTTTAHASLAQDEPVRAGVVARRVLIVEDDDDNREMLEMTLRLIGHDTRSARDGAHAIEQAALFRPHVVLLDIGLPDMNGYEVARRMRQQVWGKEAVLIALTGWTQAHDHRSAAEAKFDRYLTKPIAPEKFERLLSDLER